MYFTTKGDDHVRRYDTADETMEVVYDGTGVLTGVDNLTIEPGTPDLYVVEDGGNREVVVLTPEGGDLPVRPDRRRGGTRRWRGVRGHRTDLQP